MIKKLKLKNVKCFTEADFEFGQLTVFCGANSAGKSTAIQCLLLLRQTYKDNDFKKSQINLTGEYFSVGHAQDLLSQNTKGNRIEIEIDECIFHSKDLKEFDLDAYAIPIENKINIEHSFFKNTFHYLSAYRLAPQNIYDVNFEPNEINFGIYGQFAIAELQKYKFRPAINQNLAGLVVSDNNIGASSDNNSLKEDSSEFKDLIVSGANSPDYVSESHRNIEDIINDVALDEKKESFNYKKEKEKEKKKEKEKEINEVKKNYTLEIALKEAMKRISKGFDIKIEGYKELDKVANSFSSSETMYSVRPVNTGFGISYVLPIVLAALCTPPGGTLVVENPEVHLHPAAQSELAKFLGQASLCGIQIVLETHSDHIINGIRIFAKDNHLDENHIVINSIRSYKGDRLITKIEIDDNGSLTDTDEGFFDQAEKDLLRLFL